MKQIKSYIFGGLLALLSFGGVADAQEPSGDVGKLSREIWWNLQGDTLEDLWGAEEFYQTPDVQGQRNLFSLPTNTGNLFGQRLRGYIVAPVTGEYYFRMAGDEEVALWLSDSESKFGKQKVLHVEGRTSQLEWGKYRSQLSEPVQLEAGKRYYVEAQQKDATGGDHLTVGCSYVGGGSLVNWALDPGAVATQSSTSGSQGVAEHAIDGNISGDYNDATITQTQNLAGSWWQVDLGADRYIDRVELFNRNLNNSAFTGRLSNFKVSVLDSAGNVVASTNRHTSGNTHVEALTVWQPGGVQGRVVKVELRGPGYTGENILSLAEVKVMGRTDPSHTYQKYTVLSGTKIESYAGSLNDVDDDEYPDDWEIQYGFDPTIYQGGDYFPLADPDRDGFTNLHESSLGTAPFQASSVPGYLLAEQWHDQSYFNVSDLIQTDAFLGGEPDVIEAVDSTSYRGSMPRFSGARLRGYITAPESGIYHFWLSGTTGCELWLSVDETKYRKRRLAIMGGETGTGSGGISWGDDNIWDQFVSQMSEGVYLEAGQKYFIEMLSQQHHRTYERHVSVAWARPGQEREDLPVNVISSYAFEAEDGDDDYLPDTWESQYGLSVTDNGLIDRSHEGENGDFDGDGLNNREEYVAGTNPANADTDGDGLPDGAELNSHGTDPLSSDAPSETVVSTVDLTTFANADYNWSLVDGGLLSDTFRGSISWDFAIPSDGSWIIQVDTQLRGTPYANDTMHVNASIDGEFVGRYTIQYGASHHGIMRILSPNITSGNHTLTLEIDNLYARRMMQITGISLRQPSGVDLDGNGIPDWVEGQLADEDYVVPHAISSATSPFCLEGNARIRSSLLINGVSPESGKDAQHWYTNLPLTSDGLFTSYTVDFANGQQSTGAVTWIETNVIESGDITLRKGDALRLTGVPDWNKNPQSIKVTLTVNGTVIATDFKAANPKVYTFNTAGTHTVRVDCTHGNQSAFQEITVTAMEATLPDNQFVVQNSVGYFTLADTQAERSLYFESGNALNMGELEDIDASNYRFRLYPSEGGQHGVLARLWQGGPILDVGGVTSILVTDALQNGLSNAFISPDFPGYALVSTPMVVLDLPPGGKIVVTIFRAGVTFLDGTKIKTFYHQDLINGMVYLEFLMPVDMEGGYCHYMDIYDDNDNIITRR